MGSNKRYPSREGGTKKQYDWRPSQIVQPVEWELHNGWPPNPIAVVRRVERPDGIVPTVRYRAVTWAPENSGRELIGYDETGDDAARAGWEHFHRHHALCQQE